MLHPPADPAPVEALADEFWQAFLQREPVFATELGDDRFDDLLPDPSPVGRAKEREACRRVLAAAEAIDRDALGVEDRITLGMLEIVARIGLAQLEQGLYQLAVVDHGNGPQQLPGNLAILQRIDTPARFERLLARLAAYPSYMRGCLGVMEEGIAAGRTAAPSVVARTIEQVERLAGTATGESPLLTAHPELGPEQQTELSDAIDAHVRPAYASFLEALRAYLPHARRGAGLWSIPDGEQAYRTLILASTTLAADPQDLHEYGLAQLAEIDRERLAAARELGHPDLAALRRQLAHDPAGRCSTPAQLLELADGYVSRARAAAPRAFGRLPRADCVVRPVEAYRERESPPAFYLAPPADGSRPGIFYVNTCEPEERPLHRVAAMTYHEAIPGHHFQYALEIEIPGLHPFRTHGSILAGLAFIEGWGLYAERLADELGLYASPLERLGMLDAQAWRAARLVVDTGIHAFGWERGRAVEFLVDAGLSRLEAETETDRYIAWPGQALAYMVGQREILELRSQLERRDGARFDVRRFHDALLGHGSLPLEVLRRELPGWVSADE